MSSTAAKSAAVVAAIALVGVAARLLHRRLADERPDRLPRARGRGTRSVDLTAPDGCGGRAGLRRTPTGSPTSSATQQGRGCTRRSGRFPRTRSFTSPCTSSTATAGLRNPFMARVRGTVGNSDAARTARRRASINPNDASHTFAVPAARLDRAARGRRRQREEPVQRRALRAAARRTTRSPSASARRARAATAGSASSPAPPASSTASAARCRRSATWTDSSTSHEPTRA